MRHPRSLVASLAALALVLLGGGAPAVAATTIAGGNVINQTWTPAGSPYVIQGDVVIPNGSTLTIQAGVTVQFAATDGLATGLDPNRVEFTVKGTLAVNGTAGSPVTFQAQSGNAAGTWYAILVDATATSAVFTSVVVTNAQDGIRSAAPGMVLAINAARLATNASAGLSLSAGAPSIANVVATGNAFGVVLSQSAAPSITGSTFYKNAYGIEQNATSGTTTITGCTIDSNSNYGIDISGNSAESTAIKNSLITSNGLYGVYRRDASSTTIANSDVWGNASANFAGGITMGAGVLSINPLYVSAAGANYTLTSNSPARFASDVGTDIGAAPYGSDATPGLYGTLWVDTHLTKAGSPYSIAGDLTVAPGRTLTIDAGVQLTFATTDVMFAGNDTTRSELIVAGSLTASALGGSPVVFTSTNAAAGAWYGIRLLASSVTTLVNATVQYAQDGIRFDSTAQGNVLSHLSLATNASAGLRVSTTVAVDDMTAHGNAFGVITSGTGSLTLTNAVLYSNAYGIEDNSTGGTLSAINCTVNASSNYGIDISGNSAESVLVENSIITNSGLYGIYRRDASQVTVSYSDVWGNASANFAGGYTNGGGNLSANPQYTAAPADLHLSMGSFCIDAGTSANAPTHDRDDVTRPLDGDGINGAQFDIGAYEFALSEVCGNGVVEPGELCDDGTNNGKYGYCNAQCSGYGPRCGDGTLNGPEVCDDGGNNGKYGFCNATCTAEGPRCGDGTINGPETCDDGANNGKYGYCNATCTGLGPRCGDGIVQPNETCDDGANDGKPGFCNATCTGPTTKCGDGIVEAPEVCDDGGKNGQYGFCNASCTGPGPDCGDGMVNGPEACDDGANNGKYGYCNAQCTAEGAHCGDGILNGPEVCDDGGSNGKPGFCNAMCTGKSALCGNGIIDQGESCDDGAQNGKYGYCNATCTGPGARCGDGTVNGPEACDDGANNGKYGYCNAQCTALGPHCGDGIVSGPEQCDDGGKNGEYGFCDAQCAGPGPRCGDGTINGPELCDDGNENGMYGYCNAFCSGPGPHCGDGVIQQPEACDDGGHNGQVGFCNGTCTGNVPLPPDMAIPPDMAVPPDMSAPPDMAIAPDMANSPDLVMTTGSPDIAMTQTPDLGSPLSNGDGGAPGNDSGTGNGNGSGNGGSAGGCSVAPGTAESRSPLAATLLLGLGLLARTRRRRSLIS